MVIRFFHPRHNGQWPLSQILSLHLFSYLNSWERASIFPFECPVLNKGTTGTIFITSLVWCGPWLGIEPGSSRTLSHFKTGLSVAYDIYMVPTIYVDSRSISVQFLFWFYFFLYTFFVLLNSQRTKHIEQLLNDGHWCTYSHMAPQPRSYTKRSEE